MRVSSEENKVIAAILFQSVVAGQTGVTTSRFWFFLLILLVFFTRPSPFPKELCMETRDMSYHRYKPRDFRFAQLLVTLRKRAKLTQEEVALRMAVTVRAIGNWEGGSNYPSELNLRKLI